MVKIVNPERIFFVNVGTVVTVKKTLKAFTFLAGTWFKQIDTKLNKVKMRENKNSNKLKFGQQYRVIKRNCQL